MKKIETIATALPVRKGSIARLIAMLLVPLLHFATHAKTIDANRAALNGTVQLSSKSAGIDSKIAVTRIMPATRSSVGRGSAVVNGIDKACRRIKEQAVPPIQNAVDPAIDLPWLNHHLLPPPYRRPTRSARPSPAAIALRAIIPIGPSLQKNTIENINMTT
jgi:hypothetical protein